METAAFGMPLKRAPRVLPEQQASPNPPSIQVLAIVT
jgi:hypothetical protein